MHTTCPGWHDKDGGRVHEGERVLVNDPAHVGAPSTGICLECRDAFLERAALVQAAQADADRTALHPNQ